MVLKEIIKKIRVFKNRIFRTVIVIIVITVVIIIAGVGGYIIYLKKNNIGVKFLTADKVVQKTINYINENLLRGKGSAFLNGDIKEVKEESGLYKFQLTIDYNGQKQDHMVYVTKDGKYLFPIMPELPINLDEKPTSETTGNNEEKEIPKTDKPKVELFVMAFCPYGNQAEEIMMPVIDLLGDKIDFVMHYIVSKDKSGEYESLHGDQELHQDIREICVFKYQKNKFWRFIEAINKGCTSQNADTCWEEAARKLGINVQQIKNCQKSEGNSLLDEEIKAVQKYSVRGSPQLFINEIEYNGPRNPESYKNAICSGFNAQPPKCQQQLSATGASAQGGCE